MIVFIKAATTTPQNQQTFSATALMSKLDTQCERFESINIFHGCMVWKKTLSSVSDADREILTRG